MAEIDSGPINVSTGILNAFNVLYSGHEGYGKVGGTLKWIFNVKRGILQGCPFCGTLVVIAIDPLLTLFEHYVHKPGLGAIYACADDIGAAIKGLRCTSTLNRLCERSQRASELTLKRQPHPKAC